MSLNLLIALNQMFRQIIIKFISCLFDLIEPTAIHLNLFILLVSSFHILCKNILFVDFIGILWQLILLRICSILWLQTRFAHIPLLLILLLTHATKSISLLHYNLVPTRPQVLPFLLPL